MRGGKRRKERKLSQGRTPEGERRTRSRAVTGRRKERGQKKCGDQEQTREEWETGRAEEEEPKAQMGRKKLASRVLKANQIRHEEAG